MNQTFLVSDNLPKIDYHEPKEQKFEIVKKTGLGILCLLLIAILNIAAGCVLIYAFKDNALNLDGSLSGNSLTFLAIFLFFASALLSIVAAILHKKTGWVVGAFVVTLIAMIFSIYMQINFFGGFVAAFSVKTFLPVLALFFGVLSFIIGILALVALLYPFKKPIEDEDDSVKSAYRYMGESIDSTSIQYTLPTLPAPKLTKKQLRATFAEKADPSVKSATFEAESSFADEKVNETEPKAETATEANSDEMDELRKRVKDLEDALNDKETAKEEPKETVNEEPVQDEEPEVEVDAPEFTAEEPATEEDDEDDGITDDFIKTLSKKDKKEFKKVFLGEDKPNFLPEYVVGGNNKKFFNRVFLFLSLSKTVISDDLLDAMCKYLNPQN